MHRIPAGEFIMGSTPEEIEKAVALDKDGALFALLHESPQFRGYGAEFYLGAFAVTNEQFARFLTDTKPSENELDHWVSTLYRIERPVRTGMPFRVSPGFERHPAAHVSWYGAAAYCQWASLRLPTEIEWERAARGQDGRIFPWGNEWQSDALSWWSSHTDEGNTAPVDGFPKGRSPYGIYQMAGNVEEWCADWYRHDVYQLYAAGDLTPPKSGRGHVVRGGNCMYRERLGFRCAMRRSSASAFVNILFTGIRCACDVAMVLKPNR